jgi:hypothetical protein
MLLVKTEQFVTDTGGGRFGQLERGQRKARKGAQKSETHRTASPFTTSLVFLDILSRNWLGLKCGSFIRTAAETRWRPK